MKAISEKAKETQRKNTNPHHLGSRGYAGMKATWEAERKAYAETGQSQGDASVTALYGLQNERGRCYLLGRRVRSADGTYHLPQDIIPVADKIVRSPYVLYILCNMFFPK